MATIGFTIGANGAFIATIGAYSADASGHKTLSFIYKVIGSALVAVGLITLVYIP